MTIEYSDLAKKQLRKLDKYIASNIKEYLSEIAALNNPRSRGKGLSANKAGLWRYRIEDIRVLCDIQDSVCIIYALSIEHRKSVYK